MSRYRQNLATIADPLTGLGPETGVLIETYVDEISTLVLLSDPLRARSLDQSRNPNQGSGRLPDTRSVWSGRRLDYEIEDLTESTLNLAAFVDSPRPVLPTNKTRRTRCPDCRKSIESSWNVCPRCQYDFRKTAGRGPRCRIAKCRKQGRPRRHGARFCDECGRPLASGRLDE